MALARLARQAKRPHGVCIKTAAVAILGLCFVVFWSMFSNPSSSITVTRESFDDIAEPVSARTRVRDSGNHKSGGGGGGGEKAKHVPGKQDKKVKKEKDKSGLKERDGKKNVTGTVASSIHEHKSGKKEKDKIELPEGLEEKEKQEEGGDLEKEKEDGEEEQEVVDGKEESTNGEDEVKEGTEGAEGDGDIAESVDQDPEEKVENESDDDSKSDGNKRKIKGPVFDPNARYTWKPCSTRSKHNYIPCIDNEGGRFQRFQSYRHTERSCPRAPSMCLVPLPQGGYESPVHWPESKSKIWYGNVAHPKLAAYIKKHSWLVESGEYLTFPQNHSQYIGGVGHYLDFIEEMVPDVIWGKNIRIVLDIGCRDSSFVAAVLDKDVLTLSLGLKDDLVDLAQLSLERGFPTFVSPFASRRLPFPSAVFDAIHCSECNIPWHSNGGKLLLEMNRILRPNGYFILSTKHDNIEDDEAMTRLTASVCWNVLAHKTDEDSEIGVKVYQKPESNDIYELRRKRNPPLCTENENPDAAWYVPIKHCLPAIPSALEEHGTEWPEEWPKRLETYPEWTTDKAKLIADTDRWKSIVNQSYFAGIGIDWSSVRNVMDMRAIYGGFAAALSSQNVWVMNVVPIHAPDTLPFIFERGLIGIYHDWCESFGSYPRSYDLLHADHLFSRLKNRCKQPASIVVEIDRLLRPGGWLIVRDKVVILDPLEEILKSLHWEIRMTYKHSKEGIICAQKTDWRP